MQEPTNSSECINPSLTASRSLSGCWTCRLRRKKCDEAYPSCQTCINLELDCSGYGAKPKWMDGGSAQALLQHNIKMQVKRTASLKRHARLLKPDASSVSVGVSEKPLRLINGTPPRSALSDRSRASSEAPMNTITTFGNAHKEQCLFGYFWTYVFALHFAYLPFSVAYAGREWLSSIMTKVQPLSDLTIALSACHYPIRTPFATVKDDSTWRQYYAHGLRGLRFKLRSFRKDYSLQGIRAALRLLACNMQLILLDLLRGLGTWLVHLRGMSGLVDMVVAFALKCESEELGQLDQNGLDFIVQVFARFDRASAMLNVEYPSLDRI